ncbi:MAG: transposase [Deltaproteobacteria bacterium]|nr:transposase [Deltaproteobacteria bacterium]
MSRPLRIEYPDAWYHVMNKGRRGEPVFRTHNDYNSFVGLLKETIEMWNVRVAAYCLMPTHYHLVIQTPDANLSRCMRYVNGIYTQRFNRNHLLNGQLFRGRYKAILVEGDSYLLELVRYVHRNPLEAGLVKELDKYRWSSHQGYLSDSRKWDWLYKDFILSLFSIEKAIASKMYKGFVSKGVPEEINGIFLREKLPSALGSDRFLDWVKSSFFPAKFHKEVPESKMLSPDAERIKEEVCRSYGVSRADLYRSRRGISNEPRNVAIYLLRTLRGDNLEEIGRNFNINRFSSVSSVVERTRRKMSKDPKLRRRVEEIKTSIKMSQA